MEKFAIFRPTEGSCSTALPLPVQGKGCLLDTVALPRHNRTCRPIMGLLVGDGRQTNRPASKQYFGFNLNFNDVPLGNANALHIHSTFEYFMAFSGDFEVRAGDGAHSKAHLGKWDLALVPAYYKRYFKCVAKDEQMHFCEEMATEGSNCALMLAGIVGKPWVQWSEETIRAGRENGVHCTNAGLLIDKDAPKPQETPRQGELDCSQEDLDRCVFRAKDRPKVTRPFGDGDMRFEYLDADDETDIVLEPTRNYVLFNLEGSVINVIKDFGAQADTLRPGEVMVLSMAAWTLRSSDPKIGALVFAISSDMSEASFPPEVMATLRTGPSPQPPTLLSMREDLRRELQLAQAGTTAAIIQEACRQLGVAFAGRPLAAVAAHCHRELLARQPSDDEQVLGDQHGGDGKSFGEAFAARPFLGLETLLQLLKWNTPTIFNGWEQITSRDCGNSCFNLEPLMDHMPQMGAMVGYAITVQISPGNKRLCQAGAAGRQAFREHVAGLPTGIPKIIVVQDLDKPHAKGSMWGEVNATLFRALGCVGCIVDGGVRDIDEMTRVGLHAFSRTTCIGHAHGGIPLRWDLPVEVFGVEVRPGQLIHADKHGFLIVPPEDEPRLLEASDHMDLIERKYTIKAGLDGMYGGKRTYPEVAAAMGEAAQQFGSDKKQKYG